MVGKFIAWLLRRAGYELTPAVAVTNKLEYLDAKAREMDGVVCDIIDDIEELRKGPHSIAAAKDVDNLAAEIFDEFLNGARPKRRDNE